MQIETIKLFCDVAEHRSISRAAALHEITQSAASQRLMALERDLGVQLIDRSTRPLQLTAAGDLYHRGCRDIMDRYEKLQRQTAALHQVPALTGEVRIASIYSAGIGLLNQIIRTFRREQSRCRVQIEYQHPEVVHDRLLHDQCDIGIISYPHRWRGLSSIALRDEAMVLICRPDHELAGREAVRPADLVEQPLVAFDNHLPIRRHLTGYFREVGIAPNIAHRFDNVDTIKTYVSETPTVAIVPGRTVMRELEQGILAAVRLEPALSRPIAIVYHKGRELPPAVQAFADFLLKHQPKPFELPAAAASV